MSRAKENETVQRAYDHVPSISTSARLRLFLLSRSVLFSSTYATFLSLSLSPLLSFSFCPSFVPYFRIFLYFFPSLFFNSLSALFLSFFSRLCSFTSACAKRGAQNDSRKTRVTKRAFGITDDGESWRWSCGLFHGRVIRLELYVSGVLDLISTIAFATYAQRRRPYLARRTCV